MISSYYFWKWADNDLPGQPAEIHAALLRGEMPPALQCFDPRRLLLKLERAAKCGEEWSWEISPNDPPHAARFVFVTCPPIDRSERAARHFKSEYSTLGLSGIDEESGHVVPTLAPKLNVFTSGQQPNERLYDVGKADLPRLLRRVDPRQPDPFGIIEDARGPFVQYYADGRRFLRRVGAQCASSRKDEMESMAGTGCEATGRPRRDESR